jgi:hypothetical protein
MAHVDNSLVQQVFDFSERKRKSDMQHHRQADDLGAAMKALKQVAVYHG